MKGFLLKYFQNKKYLSGDHHTGTCPATTTPTHRTPNASHNEGIVFEIFSK
jgi:hypothetical protein